MDRWMDRWTHGQMDGHTAGGCVDGWRGRTAVGQWAGAWIPWTVQLADFPRGRGAADGFTRLRDLISCNCCLSRGAGMGGDGRGREGTGGDGRRGGQSEPGQVGSDQRRQR
jgi:hypothetical protein